jgi:hypothetical protein
MMIPRTFTRAAAALAGLVAFGSAAFAQTAACQLYRAELASLSRSGVSRAQENALRRSVAEINGMIGYYRSIGCDRGGFGFFGPPAECPAIAHRIQAMQAAHAQLAARADPHAAAQRDARRRQLNAAVAQACAGPAPAPEPRQAETRGREERAASGRRTVCVRTCDGFFFPLDSEPAGRGTPDGMCQALCPGAETAAYRMPLDGDITEAVSTRGQPYTRLKSASLYQKSYDPDCACRKSGQSWAQALAAAEKMIERRRGDILVTAAKAEELSRPRPDRRRTREARRAPPATAIPVAARAAPVDVDATGSVAGAETAESRREAAEADKDPTASRDSAGIGPKTIEGERVLGVGEGATREVAGAEGRRRVRIVAPNIIPVPALPE